MLRIFKLGIVFPVNGLPVRYAYFVLTYNQLILMYLPLHFFKPSPSYSTSYTVFKNVAAPGIIKHY